MSAGNKSIAILDEGSKVKKITVIIPAYNEGKTIETIIKDILKEPSIKEVLVIDDGSADNQFELAQAAGAKVLRHPYNIGNGAAIKTGIRSSDGDIFIFMDADGQHDSTDIAKLLNHIHNHAMVVGARAHNQQASYGRRWMNCIFNYLASYVTGFKVQDLTSGFRAIRADLARELLPLLPNGYSWPTTMTLVLLRSGMSVKYVPVNVRERQAGHSSIRPVSDGIRFLMIIIKICTLYSPFRIFLPVSSTIFVLGLINYAYTFLTTGRFTNMSAVLFTSAVIVFMMGLVSEQISQISLLRQQVQSCNMEKPGGEANSEQD